LVGWWWQVGGNLLAFSKAPLEGNQVNKLLSWLWA